MKKQIIFSFLLVLVVSQSTNLSSANYEYDGILGVGWGVFAIILSIIIGLFCCLFGLSTLYSGLFNAIGICIPVTVFIFMIIVPLTKPGNQNSEDNQTTNNFIVVRWLFFTFMLIFLFIACIPLLKLWRTVLIPQRVDSRSQKEYHESYQARMDLEENKEKMDGGGPAFEGESILPLKDNVNLNEGTDEERPLTLFNNDENKSPDEDKERRRKRLKALKRIIKTDQLEQINEI